MTDEEFLAHYGILGMKWGVRKRRTGSSSVKKRSSSSDDDSKESLLKSTSAKKVYSNRKRLSDKELRDRLNRIQMEKQLKDLSAQETKTGMDYVNKILKYGKTANEVYALYNSPLFKTVRESLGKKSK